MMVNLDNKKERMHSELKGQLLSSNDHVRQWQRNKMKGDGLTENFEEREKGTDKFKNISSRYLINFVRFSLFIQLFHVETLYLSLVFSTT